MSEARATGIGPHRDSGAMACFWRGVHLKEEAVDSGTPETMREAVRTLEAIEHDFPDERTVIAKSLLQLSDCFALAGDPERARKVLARAADEFREDDREAAALATLGLSRYAARETGSVADLGANWWRSLEALSDSEQRHHVGIWYAQALLQRGDLAGCRAQLEQILGRLSLESSPHLFLWAQDLVGISHIVEGDRRRAQEAVEELKSALSSRLPEEILNGSMTEALLSSSSEAL